MSFADKVVLVTGAASGIGAVTAIMFAKEEATVIIVDNNGDKLEKFKSEFNEFGKKHLFIKADVSKDDEAKSIVKQTIDAFGKLNVLVNNAGILRKHNIDDTDFVMVFDEVMNTNLRAAVVMTNLAVPYLKKTKGNIVNVSSIAATKPHPSQVVTYKTSKAGLNHFSRCTALELAGYGVRVNTVSPGPAATDLFESAGIPGYEEVLRKASPLGCLAESEEISGIILFLASDKAKSVTGSDYVIDNGLLLS